MADDDLIIGGDDDNDGFIIEPFEDDQRDNCVVHQFLLEDLKYWQVPRDSLQILDFLKMHKFSVKKDRRDPKKPNDYRAKIFGRKTKAQIADYTVLGTKSELPTYDETIPLRLIYRYGPSGDFSQINDTLELKAVLDENKEPYRESGKQEILRRLNYEIGERNDSAYKLKREIGERCDLSKKLEGRE